MDQMMIMKNTMIGEANREEPVHEDDLVDSFSSSSLSSSGNLSGSSSDSDVEEVTSPAFSSTSSSSSSSSGSSDQLAADPLLDMSSLFQQLPIKRGLSKHYQGKSQSFTSLANVRSLEDLAKPENPYNKKMKSCRSYGGGLAETHRETKCNPDVFSRHISSRGPYSSLSAKKGNGNLGNRPPMPPHRSTSTNAIPNQTPLFA